MYLSRCQFRRSNGLSLARDGDDRPYELCLLCIASVFFFFPFSALLGFFSCQPFFFSLTLIVFLKKIYKRKDCQMVLMVSNGVKWCFGFLWRQFLLQRPRARPCWNLRQFLLSHIGKKASLFALYKEWTNGWKVPLVWFPFNVGTIFASKAKD